MTLPGKKCVSCGRLTHDYTEFECPACGKNRVIRCYHCRKITNVFACDECNFSGP